jgi:putative phosphoribosyl transferase
MVTSNDRIFSSRTGEAAPFSIPVGKVELEAEVFLPRGAQGLVLFAHGSGSSHKSPRNQFVAHGLHRRGIGTLSFAALTRSERRLDALDQRLRFDIRLLARRLTLVTDWVRQQTFAEPLAIGYFGASTGAAAAIVAAAERPDAVRALVCRGGRPDLAGRALLLLRTPTLLLVGSEDTETRELNELAVAQMSGVAQLEVVPSSGHLFEEPGALKAVRELAGDWFARHLPLGVERTEARVQ